MRWVGSALSPAFSTDSGYPTHLRPPSQNHSLGKIYQRGFPLGPSVAALLDLQPYFMGNLSAISPSEVNKNFTPSSSLQHRNSGCGGEGFSAAPAFRLLSAGAALWPLLQLCEHRVDPGRLVGVIPFQIEGLCLFQICFRFLNHAQLQFDHAAIAQRPGI